MPEKIYFYLLILCGILFQGIIGTVGDEIEGSSNFLPRQKRVVSYVPGEDVTATIYGARYIVVVRENMRINCVGSILSRHVVITITQCVHYASTRVYQVVSGTSRADRGNTHDVIDIKKHYGDLPSRNSDGIALLTVNPHFSYSTSTDFIPLHTGRLPEGSLGFVSGWGFNYRCPERGTSHPASLRSIEVPIIAHENCVNRYLPYIQITDKDICTYHAQKHCGHTDGGAPLVVNGHLVGVHLWTGPNRVQNNANYPDVFAFLQHPVYIQWITTNIRDIEARNPF